MPEYLDDPSVLTKDKLKSELLAHNVELPSGNPTKDVYVQLYLKNLTAHNKKHVTATTLDAFSSDEELPPPVVSSRSRSSGRKATKKTDKVLPDELDVTVLTDEGLKDELLKHGVDAGPIVASTRKLYEKKLQRLLDDGPAQLPTVVLTEIQVNHNHNGNSESDLYSDKEDEVTASPDPEPEPEPEPEPVAEPEPAPVVERPVRSRGKTPVTTRTRSSQHQTSAAVVVVPEDLRPVLSDQVQLESNRRVLHRPGSPARSGPPSASSRPAQSLAHKVGHKPRADPVKMTAQTTAKLQEEERRPSLHLPSKTSPHRPASVHDTALLEEPEPSIEPVRPAAGTGSLTRNKPGPGPTAKPSRPFEVDPEECDPPHVPLHKRRQQKITSFLSGCSPVKTLSCPSTLSHGVMVRQVEKIAASEQTAKVEESEVLKELFPNDINSPTGITATCRRPIRGAARRPLQSSDLWNSENCLFSPKITKTTSSSSSYTESCTVNRVSSLPPSTSSTSTSSFSSSSSSSSRLLSAAPPAAQSRAGQRSMSLWIKLFLLAIVAAFLFLVYQAMETNIISPFGGPDTEVASDSTA